MEFVGLVVGFVWWVISVMVIPWVWWVIGFGSCRGFYFCGCGLIFLGSCGLILVVVAVEELAVGNGSGGGLYEVVVGCIILL